MSIYYPVILKKKMYNFLYSTLLLRTLGQCIKVEYYPVKIAYQYMNFDVIPISGVYLKRLNFRSSLVGFQLGQRSTYQIFCENTKFYENLAWASIGPVRCSSFGIFQWQQYAVWSTLPYKVEGDDPVLGRLKHKCRFSFDQLLFADLVPRNLFSRKFSIGSGFPTTVKLELAKFS